MSDAPGRWHLDALAREGTAAFPGFRAEAVASIDSTNTELMRRARAGRLPPTLLVAEVQTAGRGRLGRAWVSGALEPRDWSGLSLAVGVSVARALHPALQLKWPNDLWLDGRKLGGILIETAQVAGERCAVIGVGINLQPPDAAGLSVPPACLQELLPGCDAASALARIVPELLAALRAFEARGLAPFLEEFHARDLLRGRTVVLSDGTSGTARGVDAGGGLLVHTPAGMTTITSSEVSVRPADHAAGRGH
jgi:BirA family biotin operon repressor/biotin-[acetyl-CoA-carboxylase] ligase